MRKFRLLDLFCGEGGASMGYHEAGFEVVGVDAYPMPKYPFEFMHATVESLTGSFLRSFDAIHASPMCKVHTSLKAFSDPSHVDQIPMTRALLKFANRPFVIENVEGAPLHNPVTLCGSMFGLQVRRHRLFETNWPLEQPACDHDGQDAASPGYTYYRYHTGEKVAHRTTVVTVAGRGFGMGKGEVDLWRKSMDMPWASREGLREAIETAATPAMRKRARRQRNAINAAANALYRASQI